MTQGDRVKVWDIGVRLFHWSLVLLFFIAYFSGDDAEELHVLAGYGIIALLLFRLVWGFIGGKYARFGDFIYSPQATIKYALSIRDGNAPRYLGHNPLGGWMVVALLLMLVAISWSGLKLLAADGEGPLAAAPPALISDARADDDEHGEKKAGHEDSAWEEFHEFLSNFTVFLIVLHIAGVAVESRREKENLARAMVTGYKKR